MDGNLKTNILIVKKEKEKFLKDSTQDYKKVQKVKKKQLKITVTVLIVLNILLLVLLLGLVLGWRELRRRSMEPHEQTMCINCTEMGLANEDMPEEVKGKIHRDKISNGIDQVCCGHTSEVLKWMVAKSINERDTGDRSSLYPLVSKECKKTTEIKPSAQVNGITESSILNDHNGVIHWNISQSAILSDLITYKHGKLSVKQSGYYFIFSQLTFRHTPPSYKKGSIQHGTISVQEPLPNHLDHFIYHISNESGKHEKILEGSKSRCEMPSSNDETTSTLGAVFYLAADDEIFVKASHPELLAPSKEKNHFGLYMT